MRKLILAAAVLVGVGLVGCEDKNKAEKAEVADSPQAAAPAPAGDVAKAEAPAAQAPQTGTVYTFGPEDSKIGFKGAKVTGSHVGGFKSFTGQIVVPGDKPETGSVNLTIDTSSLYSDSEKLTGHLKSPDFFDVQKYPKATFTSTSIAAAEGGKYKVTGDLTLHGVTKQVSFPATVAVSGDSVKAQSEFSLNRKDFGIVYPGMPDDLIRDDVVLTLDINAKKSTKAPEAAAGGSAGAGAAEGTQAE